MTYSIAVVDPDTGALGVAVASHYLAVGANVAAVRSGVGIVVSQSFADHRHYGEPGLELLAGGRAAPQVLAELVGTDRNAVRAQIAVVDGRSRAVGHTGDRCVPAAEQIVQDGLACQANMVHPGVCRQMVDAFRDSGGDFAERLLAALDAAEAAGGDRRGRQAAALRIVPGPGQKPDQAVDLRVDDDPEPLRRLRALDRRRRLARDVAAAFVDARAGDVDGALQRLQSVQRALGESDLEPTAWAAVVAARAGDVLRARRFGEQAAAARPEWTDFLRAMAQVGMVPAEFEAVLGGLRLAAAGDDRR